MAGAVETEHDPVPGPEVVPVPAEGSCHRARDIGEEGIVAPDLLHERLQVGLVTVGEGDSVSGVLAQRHGREDDEMKRATATVGRSTLINSTAATSESSNCPPRPRW
jgi:hypothetical protein